MLEGDPCSSGPIRSFTVSSWLILSANLKNGLIPGSERQMVEVGFFNHNTASKALSSSLDGMPCSAMLGRATKHFSIGWGSQGGAFSARTDVESRNGGSGVRSGLRGQVWAPGSGLGLRGHRLMAVSPEGPPAARRRSRDNRRQEPFRDRGCRAECRGSSGQRACIFSYDLVRWLALGAGRASARARWPHRPEEGPLAASPRRLQGRIYQTNPKARQTLGFGYRGHLSNLALPADLGR
jgi:hypothetical protein